MSPLPSDPLSPNTPFDAISVDRSDLVSSDSRRRIETASLSLIALIGVWWPRYSFESTFWLSAEILFVLLFAAFVLIAKHARARAVLCAALLFIPIIFALVARQLGSPIPFEMTGISTLGVGSLVLALQAKSIRNLALSVVASGFLVLFATFTLNEMATPVPAIAWITVCLWHLVANHWERVSACTPEEVRYSAGVRPVTVLAGLLLFAVGGWAIHGRFVRSQPLSWGFMPTSGGTSWSDPAARSGVGSGDAAIAAKDHAESFGAVESDLFLESTDSTLFDMFSDSIGQPKLKPKWERRQGMTPENLIHAHQRTAKSERGGDSFSTSRTKPLPPQPLNDAKERAILQWIGPTGIRLAMNRYDTFDGVDWSQRANWKTPQLSRVEFGDEPWFFDPRQKTQVLREDFDCEHGGILKVLRLDSTRIPSPMMTTGVHIKDVDRQDFFGIEQDGSLFMPGRVKIPALSILHLASTRVSEDELLVPHALADFQIHQDLIALHAESSNRSDADEVLPHQMTRGEKKAAELAKGWTRDEPNPFLKLQAITDQLRTDFEFDRHFNEGDDPDPLDHFLRTQRGGDHLFATAAAVMGRAIGLNTRLVSGFYVRPGAVDIGQGHASVLPEDVHVWAEVQLNDGRWIEIEPTPGYRQPIYKPSAWLLAKRFAAANWPWFIGAALVFLVLYLTRIYWFELFFWTTWRAGRLTSDRRQVSVLLWILQLRARLAGNPRCVGTPQRDWILSLTEHDEELASGALACCNAADQMIFGKQVACDWSAPANLLAKNMTTHYIALHSREDSSPKRTSV